MIYKDIEDEIENTGDRTEPLEILYHMNMGYPLLDEDSDLMELHPGDNVLTADAASGREGLQASISFYPMVVGILPEVMV